MREYLRKVHFVGIGGAGMSGIAEVLLDLGYQVSGSDLSDSAAVKRLKLAGATVHAGHASSHVGDADVVVVSTAISESNPEISAAHAARIPVIPRAEMLGELMRFRKGIAVAGTHGKTTTTSLVAAVLAHGDMDPTFIVGGLVRSIDSNSRLGKGEYLVAEADESDASFLHLQPLMAVVTNIDVDHMSTYDGDFEGLKQTFVEFLHNLPFYGLAFLCIDDPAVRDIVHRLRKPAITFGTASDAAYRAIDIQQRGTRMHFSVVRPDKEQKLDIDLALPGRHNVLNALAAVAVADRLNISDKSIQQALTGFHGIGRRFEILGELNYSGRSIMLVDDYAHHPREIQATMAAAEGAWKDRRRVVVFQPHRYSRTEELFDDFVQVLEGFDPLIISEVYPAGETPISNADGRALCRAIRARGKTDPLFLEDIRGLDQILSAVCLDGDVVFTLGAGTIGAVARELLDSIRDGGRES